MKIQRLLPFLLAAACAADTYPRQPGIDVLHYVFQVELSDASDMISGHTTIDLRFVQPGVTEVAFDLAQAMHVSQVEIDGRPARFSHANARLAIALPEAQSPLDRRTLTVRYYGVPKGGLRIGPNKYGERTFFSENWPDQARQWLPAIDHPYDKATSEFLITAPAKYQVVANGLLQQETSLGDGRRLTHWKQSVPVSVWQNTIGVAQFAVRYFGSAKDTSLSTWVFHQDREGAIVTFEGPAKRSIEFFSDFIGPYPYEKLANVQAAGLKFGGVEHASTIFYAEGSVGKPGDSIVSHEIAHQWFGDSVTEKDWDDVWLSEGFATYFSLLYTEHFTGRDAFVAALKRGRDQIFAMQKRNPDWKVTHDDLADMSKVLNNIVYQKGGWTLHMLRSLIGDDKFQAGIRDYYRLYRDSTATTTDLRRVMEEASGTKLDWFFNQWLRRAGTPVVNGTWTYNTATKQIELTVRQTQPGPPYRLLLEFEIAGSLIRRELTEVKQTFTIPATAEPATVLLDPRTVLLAEIHFARK